MGNNGFPTISPSDLGRRFRTAPLKDKTLNSCLDLPDEPISPEAVRIIKAITGQDNIGIEKKFKQDVFERLTVKFLFASNHMIKSNDTAFTDRMIIIPFQYAIPKDRQIFDFEKKLLKERDGIVLKAMHYYERLVTNNYTFELALSTGMRSGEIRGLEWKDIDFQNKIIHVRGTLVQNKYRFYKDSLKTQSSYRDIPMLDNIYTSQRAQERTGRT
ncbi:MAG: tyrosine-type recombinase/integrase [Lachnospiraceae bacterium]|nr:tyrosine-type recombinase/integrase [Lachnospiraceae bacterium]